MPAKSSVGSGVAVSGGTIPADVDGDGGFGVGVGVGVRLTDIVPVSMGVGTRVPAATAAESTQLFMFVIATL